MSYIDDFKLGSAGLGDVIAHSLGFNTHLAADVYTDQTAETQNLSDEEKAALLADAKAKEDAGLLKQAVDNTIKQTADMGESFLTYLKWGLAAGLAIGVIFLSYKVWRAVS